MNRTKIWNCWDPFINKVNFVDSNNVILGYDLGQCCCEDAFWTVSESKDGSNPMIRGEWSKGQEFDLVGYVFDKNFFEEEHGDGGDEDNIAIFKLVHVEDWDSGPKPNLFVRLENHHNGYYGHGFVFRGAKTIEGTL